MRIRIMTFNIQGASYPEIGLNSWQSRASLNIKTIKQYMPDLIGFQEVQAANLEAYHRQLVEYNHVAGIRYGHEEQSSIFWNPSRLELIESGEFWLSRTPHQLSCDWGAHQPIGVTWVKLRCLESDSPLLHLNTHLDHTSSSSRLEGSKFMVERISQLQESHIPVIVTGDFNCNPGSPPYDIFKQSGFVDTYLAAGNEDGAVSTFHGFEGPGYSALRWGTEPFWRVDWILTRDGLKRLQTISCTVVRDAEPPLYPSDHYPIVSEVMLVGS